MMSDNENGAAGYQQTSKFQCTFWLLHIAFTHAASCNASDPQSTIVHIHRYYESQKLAIL